MDQLINKSSLVAKIEKLKNDALQKKEQCKRRGFEKIMHQIGAYNKIHSFLDTMEVKEVDFGTEVYKYIEEHFNMYDDGNQTLQTKDKKSLIGMADAENIAKHFFELGLKAQKGE